MRTMSLALTALAMLILPVNAKALMIAPSPISIRVANADVVAVGKVTAIDTKMIKSEMFKGDERQMQVATVKVSDMLMGKGREIKVAFFAPMNVGGGVGIGRPIRPINRGGVQLTKDMEACLFLVKHPKHKDTYVVQQYFDVINKAGNTNFGAEVDQAKKAVKLLMNATKGLKSKDADERLETAAMLLTRYRSPRGGETKMEQIPAEESKLILNTIADAEWNNRNPNPRMNFMMNPQTMFFQLGLTPKDGWTQPRDFKQLQTEAKKWLKDNAGKYRINRYVGTAPPKADPTEPPAEPK